MKHYKRNIFCLEFWLSERFGWRQSQQSPRPLNRSQFDIQSCFIVEKLNFWLQRYRLEIFLKTWYVVFLHYKSSVDANIKNSKVKRHFVFSLRAPHLKWKLKFFSLYNELQHMVCSDSKVVLLRRKYCCSRSRKLDCLSWRNL